jgi:hypothetical protein
LDLDIGLLIVLLVRFTVPLTIFRWPLWGAVASMAADALDVVAWSLMPWGGYPDSYHTLDKFPDMYYMGIELIVSQTQWGAGWPRRFALGLFAVRLTGFVLFEVTGERKLLFLFPNLFESFFLFVASVNTFVPWYRLTPLRMVLWLTAFGVPIWVKEYFLHWQRIWDDVVAVDVIEDVTNSIVNWLSDWYALLAAAILLAAAVAWTLARSGRLSWVRPWFEGQLHMRGYGSEIE